MISIVVLLLLAGAHARQLEPTQTTPWLDWGRLLKNSTTQPASAPGERRPRIYIYPFNISEPQGFWVNRDPQGSHAPGCFYGLDVFWPEMLMASPYVTTDPDKADYFWFPSYLYFGKNRDMEKMIKAMQAFGPWFDRKQGSDHIWAISDDFGCCAIPYKWVLPKKAIVIHHFGRVYDVEETWPCKIYDKWADQCETHIRQWTFFRDHSIYPCHKPGIDIVTPPVPLFENNHHVHPKYGMYSATKHTNRSTVFFLAGGINLHRPGTHDHDPDHPESDTYYSFGVRQTVHKLFKDRPGWSINEGHVAEYHQKIMNTIFCLAPAGWGWGGRMKASVLYGCIPVIVQPNIKVEWEEQLPLKDYAIRIPFYMLYKLPEILEVLMRKGRHIEMLKAMECTWRFHYWRQPHGRAFDLIMCELKARLSGSKVHLNTTTCELTCGQDSQPINMFTAPLHPV